MIQRRDFLKTILPLPLIAGLAQAQTAGGKEKPQLSIGIIADPQYADKDPYRSRHYRESLGKIRRSVAELNQHDLDLVASLGDIIDEDYKSFTPVLKEYRKLKAPCYHILGNHDYSVADADKEKVPAAMGLEKGTYYSMVREGWRLIFLDGTDLSTFRYQIGDKRRDLAQAYLDKLLAAKARQAIPWNSGIGSAQMKWLQKELKAAHAAKQRVLVFNHLPVLPAGSSHNLWNDAELVALLEKHSHVAAYLNGHDHAGNYALHKGTHYVNFKGMVETKSTTAYAIIHCYHDRLEINGYGAEPDRLLD